MTQLSFQTIGGETVGPYKKTNPLLRTFGPGPEGAKCKSCASFVTIEMANTYLKCRLFGITGGPATDWRANWPACGKYEAAK